VVVAATVEPHLTAVVAETTTWEEYPLLWRRLLDEVYGFVRPRPDLSPGDGWHNVMLYKDDTPSVEVGVLVGTSFAPDGRVIPSQLPGGEVLTTTHRGDWELGPAHDAVHRFATEQGLALTGVRWEIYGHGHEEPRTDIYYLVSGNAPTT
jgi:effector-binding domain-containing protein